MINSIRLKNFESHADTKLRFTPGVNVIIGMSDSGKTSILRALRWVKDNRPLGDGMVSDWTRDSKGVGQKMTMASVMVDDGAFDIHRIRDKDFNGYEIDNEESGHADAPYLTLEAIKTEVPEDVSKILNMSEVNIQSQHDAPFLLSQSSGEVARFLNQTIKLDVIDRILALAESKKRKSRQEHEFIETQVKVLTQDIKDLEWIDGVEVMLDKAQRYEEKCVDAEFKSTDLFSIIGQYQSYEDDIIDAEKILGVEGLIEKAESIYSDIYDLESRSEDLENFIESYAEVQAIIDAYKDIDGVKELIQSCTKIVDDVSDLEEGVEDISKIIENIKVAKKNISEYQQIIDTNTKMLPNTCPLCGAKI